MISLSGAEDQFTFFSHRDHRGKFSVISVFSVAKAYLEVELQSKLDNARADQLAADLAEGRAVDVLIAYEEDRVVKDVEELGAELRVYALSKVGLLDDAEVHVESVGPVELEPLQASDLSRTRVEE